MNAWEQVDQIATEALASLQDSLVISNLAARDKTSDFNRTASGYAVGQTVRIKTRPDYEAKEFTGSTETQGIRESARSMTIEKHFDISVKITAKEKALDFESFTEQVVNPAVMRLAEKIDLYTGTKILNGAGMYASNDLLGTAADMAQARKEANWQQLNPQGRFALLNSDLEASLLGKDYFIKYDNRGSDVQTTFREAQMGRAMGFNFFSSLQFPELAHTAGTGTAVTSSTAGVNLVGSKVLTVNSVDLSTNSILAGDRIRVAGLRRPLIVAADATGVSTTEIQLVDPITEIVPAGAAVTVVGSGQALDVQGALFDGESLAIAMPVLDSPSDKPSFVVSDNGFSIRVVEGYDMTSKTEMMSLDVLVGAEAYDPRRITLLADYA